MSGFAQQLKNIVLYLLGAVLIVFGFKTNADRLEAEKEAAKARETEAEMLKIAIQSLKACQAREAASAEGKAAENPAEKAPGVKKKPQTGLEKATPEKAGGSR